MKVITVATCSLALGVLCLSLASTVSAADEPAALHRRDVKNVQQSLIDKGFYHGSADGVLGPQTRAGIREYQKSESLPVTGRLDKETAGKLGVGPESVGGNFKEAGQDVGKGGQDVGHEMKNGKPVAAGKEFGQEVGHAGKKVGQGVKKAVSPNSDRTDREKQNP
jgi:peptidoglycan hydrolase-like protein with peptidoglycan-binding domain